MIETAADLDQILSETSLDGVETMALSIPLHGPSALAIKVDSKNAVDAWTVCRSKLGETGRWTLVVIGWSGAMAMGPWASALPEEGLFLRNSYAGETVGGRRDVSPSGLSRRRERSMSARHWPVKPSGLSPVELSMVRSTMRSRASSTRTVGLRKRPTSRSLEKGVKSTPLRCWSIGSSTGRPPTSDSAIPSLCRGPLDDPPGRLDPSACSCSRRS